MTSAFEPGRSSSMFRQSFAPTPSRPSFAPTPSVADSLPHINWGFDDLRDRMNQFSARFDAFIEQGRKRVLDERNQFRLNVAELKEDQRMKKKDMEIVQMKTTTFQQTVAKETAEAREIQEAIGSLSSELDKHAQTRDALKAQIATTQREIDARLAAQRAHAAQLDAQARFNVPELDFWVNNLGLRIEGAGRTDHLKFVYTSVDERDWDREAWFELVTEARDYDVRSCRPRLEREKVERVLDRVNETRELAVLLKGMRELFVEAMKG